MKIIRSILNHRTVNSLFTTLVFLSLIGCNQDPQITPGSKIVISPSERSIRIEEVKNENEICIYDENYFLDTPVSISLTNQEGSPIGDAEVSVYVDYSGNTFSGYSTLALYADTNGNGVVDTPDELVSGVEDDIYRTKTAKYTGIVTLLLRMNLSCAYRGQVNAFSGPAFGSMDIDIHDDNASTEN